jgi:vacuolar protein sorting-associated protein 54
LESVFLVLLQVQRRVALLNEIIMQQLRDVEHRGIVLGVDSVHPIGTEGQSAQQTTLMDRSAPQQQYNQYLSDTADILFATSDLAHVRCGKLLTLRAEQNAQLNFADFFKIFELAWCFVAAGEWVCRRSCIGLRGTLMTQAKAFLKTFHAERLRQLTMYIDNDQWTQADIVVDFQHMVDKLARQSGTLGGMVDGSTTHLAELDTTAKLVKDDDEQADRTGRAGGNVKPYFVVDRRRFHVVDSCMMFVKMLHEYVQCATSMTSLTTDVLTRLVEILKVNV